MIQWQFLEIRFAAQIIWVYFTEMSKFWNQMYVVMSIKDPVEPYRICKRVFATKESVWKLAKLTAFRAHALTHKDYIQCRQTYLTVSINIILVAQMSRWNRNKVLFDLKIIQLATKPAIPPIFAKQSMNLSAQNMHFYSQFQIVWKSATCLMVLSSVRAFLCYLNE